MTYDNGTSTLYEGFSRVLLFNINYRKEIVKAISEASDEQLKLSLGRELYKVNERIRYTAEGRNACREKMDNERAGELEKKVA